MAFFPFFFLLTHESIAHIHRKVYDAILTLAAAVLKTSSTLMIKASQISRKAITESTRNLNLTFVFSL